MWPLHKLEGLGADVGAAVGLIFLMIIIVTPVIIYQHDKFQDNYTQPCCCPGPSGNGGRGPSHARWGEEGLLGFWRRFQVLLGFYGPTPSQLSSSSSSSSSSLLRLEADGLLSSLEAADVDIHRSRQSSVGRWLSSEWFWYWWWWLSWWWWWLWCWCLWWWPGAGRALVKTRAWFAEAAFAWGGVRRRPTVDLWGGDEDFWEGFL